MPGGESRGTFSGEIYRYVRAIDKSAGRGSAIERFQIFISATAEPKVRVSVFVSRESLLARSAL